MFLFSEDRFCFNSLQTGKHIQRSQKPKGDGEGIDLFQFPSNGKTYPKQTGFSGRNQGAQRFNSLQTGKHIQSPLVLSQKWY